MVASFCLGLALSRWKWLSERQLVVLTVAALVLACFPLWIRYYLLVSSSVSLTSLAIVLRQLGLIAFFAPFGLLVGCVCLPTGSRAEGKLFVQSWQVSCFALLAGATVGWSLISAFGPVLLVAVCLIAFAALTCLRGENGLSGNSWLSRVVWFLPLSLLRPAWLWSGVISQSFPLVRCSRRMCFSRGETDVR